MKVIAATRCLRVLRAAVVLTVLTSGSISLFGPSSARAFVLSVGPTSGSFGGYVCADVVNGSLAPNELVQAYDCNGAPNQQFEFNGDRIYTMGGQRCLDVPGFPDGSCVVRSSICNPASPTQHWTYAGEIFNGFTGRCLDAGSMANNTPLVVGSCGDPKSLPASVQWQIK